MGNLGLSACLVGRVGDDEAGRMCVSLTEGAGVDCSRVRRAASGATGTSVNLVNEEGEASHVCHPGENTRFSTEDIPFDLFSEAKYASLHSLLALPRIDANAVFRAAREGGAKTFADTTPIRGYETIDMISGALPLLDVFAPSRGEISFLLGTDDPETIARELLSRGVGMAVVKLGAEGCYVADGEGGVLVPAYKVDVVNATGAGDNFAAGFLYGLCRGYTKESCGKIGNACGAITAASLASTGAVKSFDQVREFIEASGDKL
jgi:sugar/nucleoside kinase (ribokinase family)